MKLSLHIVFWAAVLVLLTLIFGRQFDDFSTSFYFVSMLLPVVVGTCYFFNLYLVPKYLLTKKYFKFSLYTVYMVIVSIYFELVVMTLSFIFLADYSYKNMGPYMTDAFSLATVLYFIVLLFSFISLVKRSIMDEQKISTLAKEKEKYETGNFTVRSNRKQVSISFEEVLFIESLGDYVKINLVDNGNVITKEKISSLEERLPDLYLRVHRSFLINREKVANFNKEEIEIESHTIPISRTYKKVAWDSLAKPD
ncbi:LytTR family transcriptional regulator DNA-binding domain-containing protein [Fulvivirga sp.]|uniref:LytTR family transcriptional regulator DNA-binding domain-containing protein n=1 Tax=Fulvivirga sp. TaxID=1931237 RepID=UPI0032ED0458